MIISQQKTAELKRLIEESLRPLITNDYILFDLPYHGNIGDTLIWEGEETFLKSLPHKCISKSSRYTYMPKKLHEDIIILLHGGGNFGDLWRIHQDFRLDILRQYPNNKIIIFPQTVHYDSKQLLSEDASIMAKHKNLTVCARDRMSYDILKQHFSNNILLVPDMAFYIDMREWKKYIKPVIAGKLLFLRRTDHELDRNQKYDSVSVNAEVHDWPTMETPAFIVRLFYKIQRLFYLIDEVLHTSFKNLFSDFVFQRILCKYNIRKGIEFISKYETVYTTRLHAGILAFMLDKPVTFFDNSYGKNRGVYDAWLKNVETIKFTGK